MSWVVIFFGTVLLDVFFGSRSAEGVFALVFVSDFCWHTFFQLLLLLVSGREGFVVFFCYAGKKKRKAYAGGRERLFETITLAKDSF